MAVSDYKTNPDENTTISGINIAEGCPPSGINNAIRQLMADVKQNADEQDSNVMTGATASAAGTSGLVPTPQAGEQNKAFFGDGKYYDVVRSVGGSTPDANGNVNAPYLPTAGGNVTGAISLYVGDDHIGTVVATNDENPGKSILIDTWEQGDAGAFIRLHKGSDTRNPGGFAIVSRNADGTIYRQLTGHINGDLWWDGKRIVRSVNGVNADINGNVNLQNVTNATYADILRGVYCLWASGPVTLPNYGSWAYIAGTHYRGWGGGSSDGACWGGTASGGTTINVDGSGTAFLAVRIG